MSSLPAISSVCVVGLAMLTMLSVLGMELFLGKMHRCTNTAVTVANKTQCLAAGGVWRKAKFNFDSFPEAFLSVFIIATGDNWQDLMYEAMDVVGVDQEPIRDNAKWACVYFFVSILFGFLLWANLFVSALIDNFNRIANDAERRQAASSPMSNACGSKQCYSPRCTLTTLGVDHHRKRPGKPSCMA